MRLAAFPPRLAGPAAELLGEPAIRIYHGNALSKEPGCGRTPWHHDAEHFPLATLQAVTAWIQAARARLAGRRAAAPAANWRAQRIGPATTSGWSPASCAPAGAAAGTEPAHGAADRLGHAAGGRRVRWLPPGGEQRPAPRVVHARAYRHRLPGSCGSVRGGFHDSTVRLPPGPAPRPASLLLAGAASHRLAEVRGTYCLCGPLAGSQASGRWIPGSPAPPARASATARTAARSSPRRQAKDQVQYTSGAITRRRTRWGGSGAVWPLGALTMGRRLRRTWSKKAGPVMPPSQIRTARAPVSRASRAAYRFHDAHEVVSSSRRTAVSWAWTSLVSSPAATA